MKENTSNTIENNNLIYLKLIRLYLVNNIIKVSEVARLTHFDLKKTKRILEKLKNENFLVLTRRGYIPTEVFIKHLLEIFSLSDLIFKLGIDIDDKNLQKAICEKADRDSQLFYVALKEGNKNE